VEGDFASKCRQPDAASLGLIGSRVQTGRAYKVKVKIFAMLEEKKTVCHANLPWRGEFPG
jgi:hypothetical protein